MAFMRLAALVMISLVAGSDDTAASVESSVEFAQKLTRGLLSRRLQASTEGPLSRRLNALGFLDKVTGLKDGACHGRGGRCRRCMNNPGTMGGPDQDVDQCVDACCDDMRGQGTCMNDQDCR